MLRRESFASKRKRKKYGGREMVGDCEADDEEEDSFEAYGIWSEA